MASYWSPRQLLNVYPQQPHFTCIGTTLKGLRCRESSLKNVHKAEADRLLDLLPPPEQFRSHLNELFPTLRHLAWLALCPRWHQNGARCQADAVAANWLQIITSSTPATTTYTYGGYQAPTMFPVSPPQTPPPPHPTLYAAVPSPHTYYNYPAVAPASIPYSNPPAISSVSLPYSNPAAVLPPSPPLSPNQGVPGAASQNGDGASRANIIPHLSSSIRTTNGDESTRIDISITVVLDQAIPARPTRRASDGVPTTMVVSSQDHSRTQTPTGTLRSSQASTHSRSSSSSVHGRMITTRDVQDILSRLESLERQAARSRGRSRSVSSRSSRSSLVASSRPLNDPRSPIGSTISDLYVPPPMGNPDLFFSAPRSRAPAPYAGSLSISTDSEPASSVVNINTPSSSGSSTPVAASLVGVQRRPITASTTCYICYDHFQSPVNAVWCRETCGQNLCLNYFDEWIESRDGLSISCPFCRQPWVF